MAKECFERRQNNEGIKCKGFEVKVLPGSPAYTQLGCHMSFMQNFIIPNVHYRGFLEWREKRDGRKNGRLGRRERRREGWKEGKGSIETDLHKMFSSVQ